MSLKPDPLPLTDRTLPVFPIRGESFEIDRAPTGRIVVAIQDGTGRFLAFDLSPRAAGVLGEALTLADLIATREREECP